MWKFWVTTWCILVPSWIIGLMMVKEDIMDSLKQIFRFFKSIRDGSLRSTQPPEDKRKDPKAVV